MAVQENAGAMLRRWIYLALFSVAGGLRSVRQHPIPKRRPDSTGRSTCPQPRERQRFQHEPGRLVSSPSSLCSQAAVGEVVTKSNAAIKIKPAKFHNLRAVSRLLVAEFYGATLWYPAQCLVELNRLQENFHGYGDDADRHLMLLATSLDDGSLVGFVDVDGREKRPGQTGVRPYLSDLAVADRCRRMGIGTELVKACEEACIEWGYNHLYLKVRTGNVAAQKLYENLGYVVHSASSSQGANSDSGSGFMVETGSDPKEVMLCGDLAARAKAREAKAETPGGGVVRNSQ